MVRFIAVATIAGACSSAAAQGDLFLSVVDNLGTEINGNGPLH